MDFGYLMSVVGETVLYGVLPIILVVLGYFALDLLTPANRPGSWASSSTTRSAS